MQHAGIEPRPYAFFEFDHCLGGVGYADNSGIQHGIEIVKYRGELAVFYPVNFVKHYHERLAVDEFAKLFQLEAGSVLIGPEYPELRYHLIKDFIEGAFLPAVDNGGSYGLFFLQRPQGIGGTGCLARAGLAVEPGMDGPLLVQ